MNPHEQAARARKVARLVEELDRQFARVGVDPHEKADGIAETLAHGVDAQHWATIALLASVRPPSSETIRQVVEAYRRRAGGDDAFARVA